MECSKCEKKGEYVEMVEEETCQDISDGRGGHSQLEGMAWVCPKCGHEVEITGRDEDGDYDRWRDDQLIEEEKEKEAQEKK